MPEIETADWDKLLSCFPNAHLLQTSSWGKFKSAFGWQPVNVVCPSWKIQSEQGCGAMVLFRKAPLGRTLAYIPKGPLGPLELWPSLIPEIDTCCRKKRAFMLIVEPDLWETPEDLSSGNAGTHVRIVVDGLQNYDEDIQPSRTILVDLREDEDSILANMKQKTRYNIRLATKKGIKVSPSQDISSFHQLMLDTGHRDKFGVHSLSYYQKVFEIFYPDHCTLICAHYQSELLAAIMVFSYGNRAWYFYGASSNQHRGMMPAYLLQWEGMRWAKSRGCEWYDFWGVPDYNEETLEKSFVEKQDGLWGIYRFKRGFGGELRRAQGPWVRIYNQAMYRLYRLWSTKKSPTST